MDFDYEAYIENIRRTLPRIDEVCPELQPDPVIEYYKSSVDISQLLASLDRTPEERLKRMLQFQEGLVQIRAANPHLDRTGR